MQIADVQELPKVNPNTVKLITLAIAKEKPDLIVFSGDQLYGLMPQFRGNTENKVRGTIDAVLKPIEEAGIPFAVTYGNHDRQCGIPNEKQTAFYAAHPGFVTAAAYEDENDGVAFIPVNNSGKHVFDVVLIDSNGQSASGEYEPVKENQLKSYVRQRENSANGGKNTPCLVIQHIPFEEYFKVIKKVPFYTRGRVEGYRNHAHEFYVLPDNIKASGGFMLESPAVPDKNSGEFDTVREGGNCLAVSVGHDHNNSFVAEHIGLKLIYTQGCGFNVYGPKKNRGVRVFDITDNGQSISMQTKTVTFADLTADRVSRPVQEFVLTHIPTSLEQVKRIAAVTAAAAAGASFAAYKIIKKC